MLVIRNAEGVHGQRKFGNPWCRVSKLRLWLSRKNARGQGRETRRSQLVVFPAAGCDLWSNLNC